MGRAVEAPPRDHLQTDYQTQAIANLADGRRIDLGSLEVKSPRRAMRWLRKRAEHFADQMDIPYARPLLAWLGDDREQHWALEGLLRGESCVVRVHDDEGTLYVLTAKPSAVGFQPTPHRLSEERPPWWSA